MHITSGWAKGMSLAIPEGTATRPTGAKVRAAILNALAPVLDGAMVLDLFAGSGALGLEAVSRGARGAIFVEQAKAATAALAKNLQELERRALKQGLRPPRVEVVARSMDQALPRVQQLGPYAVICMDPPYVETAAWLAKIGGALAAAATADAILIVESGAADLRTAVAAVPGFPWRLLREKQYGETTVTTWDREPPPAAEG